MKEIKNIGVVGEGKMGTSIFLYLNGFNFNLRWLCSSDAESENAQKLFTKKTKTLFQCGVLTEQEFNQKTNNTKVSCFTADLSDCDLILETITEDIGVKRKLFALLDLEVNENCIFCTNSSSIIPSLLVPSDKRKDKFCGLHFFFPVPLKSTVELIVHSASSEQTRDILVQFLNEINKTPFLQKEENAFVLNKIFLDFQAEAYSVFLEGKLSYREIDSIVKENLFPIGVFEFFDHVGIDVMSASIRSYSESAKERQVYKPLIQKLDEMARNNQLGIKTGKGFYTYIRAQQEDNESDNEIGLNHDEKRQTLERLRTCFLTSVQNVITSGICTVDELRMSVKDYMGMDRELF